ncbi:MAG: Lrp/AsnC ligand binding domain-containing protein [Candidatus Thorarchaeota archaeon]|jgi:DNA-binding Lrp family transcriptional regulator
MASVHILIQAESGQMWAISEALEKVEHVDAVHVVTGPYDIIVHLSMPVEDLRDVMDSVHKISGIIRTETCIAVRT